jgi:LuxR family maltose regulon positive regulatory protein
VSAQLLKTKLYVPPLRSNVVRRPRLVRQLNEGLARRLTLISAPAGFGKTTMLSEWAAAAKRPVAWITLDGADNDPARFWSHVIAALQMIQDDVGAGMLTTLRSSQPQRIEALLTGLINEIIELPVSFVLVLDDFHVIDAPQIHAAVTMLLENVPPQMHLILSGRADPPWPLARLRARSQMSELRSSDLRFTSAEVGAFLNDAMGLQLSPEDVSALDSRTEGWIAGLQLAALSIQGRKQAKGGSDVPRFIRSFTGSHRFVLDYLLEEVLDQQAADVQMFLLRTSILDRLTGPLCDAVTGRDDGQAVLHRLEQGNLFVVPLDEERRWYRYHPLFAELLSSHLQQTQPDRVPALHRRASEWHERNGLIAAAVDHAQAAGDVERVAGLAEKNALAMLDHGELATVVGWLDALPIEVVRERPWLSVARAWALLYTGQLDAIGSPLRDAERALEGLGDAPHVAGHIAVIRGYVAGLRGDMDETVRFTREALVHLPEEAVSLRGFVVGLLSGALRWRGELAAAAEASTESVSISRAAGDSHVVSETLFALGAVRFLQGRLRETFTICREALRLADGYARRHGRRLPVMGSIYRLMSQVLYEWNDLEGALSHARAGTELSEQWGWVEGLAFGYIPLARALQASGDVNGAHDAIHKAKQAADDLSPWFGRYVAAHEAGLWLAHGDLVAASRWAQESGWGADDEPDFQHATEYIVLSRVLIAQGQTQQALALLGRLLELAEAAGANVYGIEILVLQALVLQESAAGERALVPLERALRLGEQEGFVRAFVAEGAPMVTLLRQAAAKGIVLGTVRRLLDAMDVSEHLPERRRGSAVPSRARNLVEPLTKRELEVLRLLASGLSNKEIAHTLVITVGTVKNHLRNIYGKLSVGSRTQAVALARDLGLL